MVRKQVKRFSTKGGIFVHLKQSEGFKQGDWVEISLPGKQTNDELLDEKIRKIARVEAENAIERARRY